jgi:hypothetical protein
MSEGIECSSWAELDKREHTVIVSLSPTHVAKSKYQQIN